MQSEDNLKCMLLNNYLFEKPNDVKIKYEMLWLYLRIVAMTYEATEKHDIDTVKQSFLNLFKEDIIFFDKKDQVQFMINNGVFKTILETNAKLIRKKQLKTIEEEQLETSFVPNDESADISNLTIKIQEMVDDTTENIEDIIENVNEVINNVENITETIQSSSVYDKLKLNCKKAQGYLSHCFGGGKTKD